MSEQNPAPGYREPEHADPQPKRVPDETDDPDYPKTVEEREVLVTTSQSSTNPWSTEALRRAVNFR